ncbi:MAG: sulfotransferase domain-containing protein [Candidatus Heimdallarchaeaceae archaeon]
MNSESYEMLRNKIHTNMVFKSHLFNINEDIMKKHEVETFKKSKIIVVVRDGRDAMVSLFHYLCGYSIFSNDDDFSLFLMEKRLPFRREQDKEISYMVYFVFLGVIFVITRVISKKKFVSIVESTS